MSLALNEYILDDIINITSNKVDTKNLVLQQYISTENMLPDRKGICLAASMPSGKVNQFLKNDTLFSNIRTYFRKVWFASFDGGSSPDVLIFRTKDAEVLDPRFLYYLISDQKFIDYSDKTSKGAKMPRGDKSAILNYKTYLPTLSVQKRISKILSDLDDKIYLNNQTNQTLESIAQAIFKSWFIDFDPVRAKIAAKQEGKDAELAAMCAISGKSETELEQMAKDDFAELQATAALFPDELVESELGEVPKGWEVTRFNKIILQYIDNRGKTPPTQIDGIPLLEVKHLPEGSLNPDLNTEKRVSLETFNNWFRAHLQEDDLIISTVGTIGRLCIIPADKKLTIAQNILGLRFKKDEVNPLFMYYQMDSCKFRNDVNARLVITVQASIKRKDLETIDLLKPDINIQNVFAEKIKPFVLSQQSDESLKLIDIRDTLLPKLLSGEVSVEDIKQQQDLA